jgi:hypothetical protein
VSYGSRDAGSRFVRALVRSSRADAPPAGAIMRARARLGVGEGSSAVPFGLTGALFLAVMILGRGWCPVPASAGVASEVPVMDCGGGVEAPPCSCSQPSRATAPSGTISGSSSGTDLSRGGSGG